MFRRRRLENFRRQDILFSADHKAIGVSTLLEASPGRPALGYPFASADYSFVVVGFSKVHITSGVADDYTIKRHCCSMFITRFCAMRQLFDFLCLLVINIRQPPCEPAQALRDTGL